MLVMFINIIVNFIDCIMAYYLSHNLLEKRVRLSAKSLFLFMTYGVIIGLLTFDLSGYRKRIIITFAMFLSVNLTVKRKIYDALIIYVIIYLSLIIVQAPSLFIIGQFELNQATTFLIAQVLALIVIFISYLKIPLYKLLNVVQKEILLQMVIFIISSVFLAVFTYLNFQYSSSFLFYFFLLIVMSLLGLYQSLKGIFFYTNQVPMQLHDVKNILMGLYISANSTSNMKMIRNDLNKSLEVIGLGTNIEDISINEHNKNILSFINQKRNKDKKDLIFVTNIQYYENNANIPLSVILYILGTLLDNAIESGTSKAILIKVTVSEEKLIISVSNEYNRGSTDDFEKMFQERYSTKKTYSSGYGLPNLSKVVNNYGGEIQLKYEYNYEQQSNYLTIIIEI